MIKLNNFISTSTIKYPLCLFRLAISARDYRLISSINLVQKRKGRKTEQPRNLLPQILRFFHESIAFVSFVFLYVTPLLFLFRKFKLAVRVRYRSQYKTVRKFQVKVSLLVAKGKERIWKTS